MTVEDFAEFNRYHARNRDRAEQLRRFSVLCVGVGATGSQVAALLAHAGCGLTLFDRDVIDEANLHRHYVSERWATGLGKAEALARKLRNEVPKIQSIRSIRGDVERISDEDLRALFLGAGLVIAATGRDGIDHRLNRAARATERVLVVPSLWAENPANVLGDVQIVAWNAGSGRRGACFSCLRPEGGQTAAPAEAQPGPATEVVQLATYTADIVSALLLTGSPQYHALWRQLNRGANYFIAPRWPPSLRSVITRPRRGCPVCSTQPSPTERAAFRTQPLTISVADLSVATALGSVVVWHALIPGFDVVATFTLVGLTGFWWLGRLPSSAAVVAAVRRWWRNR